MFWNLKKNIFEVVDLFVHSQECYGGCGKSGRGRGRLMRCQISFKSCLPMWKLRLGDGFLEYFKRGREGNTFFYILIR